MRALACRTLNRADSGQPFPLQKLLQVTQQCPWQLLLRQEASVTKSMYIPGATEQLTCCSCTHSTGPHWRQVCSMA